MSTWLLNGYPFALEAAPRHVHYSSFLTQDHVSYNAGVGLF